MKSLVYVVIALAAGLLGFVIYRQVIEPRVWEHVGLSGSAETDAPAGRSLDMPTHLPDFTLMDRAGEMRSIQSWPGKSLIVNFWATWCAPCRREIPLLKQIQEEHGDEGFQVVGIAVDFREDVLAYADEMSINYPLLIGEQDGLDAIGEFGISAAGFPFTVFTDAQSRIVLTHLGEVTEEESKVLLDVVRRVNAGELTPGAARSVAAKQLAEIESEDSTA
jgi:thiol-disulfide isomerase/thioredoxin